MVVDREPGSAVFAFYEAWNDRDLDRCQALLDPRCTIEDRIHGEVVTGLTAARNWLARRAEMSADTVVEVVRVLTEGDWVVAETTSRAPNLPREEHRCEIDHVCRGRIRTARIYERREPT
jgi:ketosteroid isomerase-like protein